MASTPQQTQPGGHRWISSGLASADAGSGRGRRGPDTRQRTGIPPEIRDKLFQPFVTTKPTGEGTGLGLSISYEIVTQQHGGSIQVDSEIGSFTEFTVRLPRRDNGTGSGNRA